MHMSKFYGILPMAGKGSRLQPIAFSKELYPVAFQNRHFAISEFSVSQMARANVDEIKLVINPTKIDIAKYYSTFSLPISCYFHDSKSLPESCLYPIFSMNDDDYCLFGLPDTLFAPDNSMVQIRQCLEKGSDLCLGLFSVADASKYDSVSLKGNQVTGVLVKQNPPLSNWIWGIWGAKVSALKLLAKEIKQQKNGKGEKLLGVGFNSLAKKNQISITGVKLSNDYFDVGTMDAVIHIQDVINKFSF